MNRYIKYCFLPLLALAACKKNTRVFEESPDVRVEKTLTAFQQVLVGAENGWKATVYPKNGKGFSFWMKFDANNRVTMISDFNTTTATTAKTSSYRLKALEQPSLLFDTYNYIHLPADPSGSISGGSNATGLASDFEFMLLEGLIDSLKNNSGVVNQMSLLGRFNGVGINMYRATAAEATAYNAGGLTAMPPPITAFVNANKFLFVKLGDDKKLQVGFDIAKKSFNIAWETDGALFMTPSPFAYTLTGIILQKPVEYKGKKVYEFTWDDTGKTLYALIDGVKYNMEGSTTPTLPLHMVLGTSGYGTVAVPYATNYAGWGTEFVTRRAQAATNLQASPYALRLEKMFFAFNANFKMLTLTVEIYQGATRFTGNLNYLYTKTAAGVFKFKRDDPYGTGNGTLIVNEMAPLTAQRLDADQFTVDFMLDGANLLGKFTSVEHPDFAFTGTFQ
jgi:hypothetical protein